MGSNRNQSTHVQKQLAKVKDHAELRAVKREEEVQPRRAYEVMYEQRERPSVSGLLMIQERSMMGLGESKWRERYVVLSPKLGNLAYWDVKTTTSKKQLEAIAESSAPLHEYPLEHLISIETNEYHNTLMLNFCKPGNRRQIGKSLTFQAESEEDFDRWADVLSCYGMKETARPAAARAA